MEEAGTGYSQHHRRRQVGGVGGAGGPGVHPPMIDHHHGATHLMKDRDAYIRHLEYQLERVSAACTQSQGFGEHLATLQDQQQIVDERITSLTKVQTETHILLITRFFFLVFVRSAVAFGY
jgi:hypothetical protein